MSTKAQTQRGHFLFRVSEYGDGTPWISTEPYRTEDRLKVLGDGGFIGFDLKPGTTIQQAGQIAEYLNDHLDCVNCALFQNG
jgi:hypothetical protein